MTHVIDSLRQTMGLVNAASFHDSKPSRWSATLLIAIALDAYENGELDADGFKSNIDTALTTLMEHIRKEAKHG